MSKFASVPSIVEPFELEPRQSRRPRRIVGHDYLVTCTKGSLSGWRVVDSMDEVLRIITLILTAGDMAQIVRENIIAAQFSPQQLSDLADRCRALQVEFPTNVKPS